MKMQELLEKVSHDERFRRAYSEDELMARLAYAHRKRMERGLTQTQVADLLGKDQAWISRLEAGEMNLRLRSLAKIAIAFNCNSSDLIAFVREGQPARVA